MDFKDWLLTEGKMPLVMRGLAAEARKAGSFENFVKDFLGQIKHGLYWHWTDDPNFIIDPLKGPRDMSSMSTSDSLDAGKLMITSKLGDWSHYGQRQYAANIDMTEVPRNAYYQVSRGFGNEFFVSDPSKARVIEVLPRKKAFAKDNSQRRILEKAVTSEEDLLRIYQQATGVK